MLMLWITGLAAPATLCLAALVALVLDAVFGEPVWLYRRVPHPVAWLGARIAAADEFWNRDELSPASRFRRGLALTLSVTLGGLAVGLGLGLLFWWIPGGWILEAVVAATLLAGRDLYDHVAAVARGLARSLPEGRAAVAHIVGRDPDALDEGGVARAALESLAENFSDGLVAPLFWYLLLGLPGLVAYKAINTLDSMLGHHTPHYQAFGRTAARLDDAVNFVPARIAGGLIVLAALALPKAHAGRAGRTMLRDAPKHRSPNAGWQEAALAGALDFALAGPRVYPDETVDDPWMGDGRSDLNPKDIRAGLHLYLAAWTVTGLVILGLWWASGGHLTAL
jgi:adenosylcobinamide-phosphate synthase